MLVLIRRPGQKIMIELPGYGLIAVEVLGVTGSQVRIGITAPKNLPIHRAEIYKRIQRELLGPPAEPDAKSHCRA